MPTVMTRDFPPPCGVEGRTNEAVGGGGGGDGGGAAPNDSGDDDSCDVVVVVVFEVKAIRSCVDSGRSESRLGVEEEKEEGMSSTVWGCCGPKPPPNMTGRCGSSSAARWLGRKTACRKEDEADELATRTVVEV